MMRLIQIVGGLIALAVGGIALWGFFFPGVPECDASNTKETLGSSVAETEPMKSAKTTVKTFTEIAETAWDEKAGMRSCKASLELTDGAVWLITYTMKLKADDRSTFELEWQGTRRPTVDLKPK